MSSVTTHKKLKSHLTTLFVVSIASTLIIVSTVYINELKQNLVEESQHYLEEISEHIGKLVQYGLNDIEKDANLIQKSVETNYNVEDIQSYLPYLNEIVKEYDLLRICIADTNGNYYATDGHTQHISDKQIYDDIIHGEQHFINYEENPDQDVTTIIYGTPLTKDGEVKAAMFISNDNLQLSETMDIQSFNNEGFSIILDSEGNYVFRSNNDNSVPGVNNFFDIEVKSTKEANEMLVMKDKLKNNEHGFIEYTPVYNDMEKIAEYRPIGNEGWFLLTIVPTNITKNSMDTFIRYSSLIAFIIICLFMAVIYLLYHNQKKSRKSLEYVAYIDPVTNGINNNRFEKDAKVFLKEKPESHYCMVSMDVKNFKLVNAALGSRTGDRMLEYIYNHFAKYLEKDELIARVHGDVFNILMNYTNEEEVIERLKNIVTELNNFNNQEKEKYYLYFQTGIYIIDIPDMSMIMIQDRANVARKKAKDNDTTDWNTCIFYKDIERQRLLREKDIENRMDEALAKDEFTIYLHPKMNIQKQEITGAEALIRWEDPIHGLLLPQQFLHVFEKNSFILKIDLFAFKTACNLLEKWYTQNKKMVQISVNVSKLHMNNHNFLDAYIQIFKNYTFPANYLRFEITEKLMCDNLALLKNVVQKMHSYGFSVSLDDFGSGYSSLNLLKDIDADELKLDQEFFTPEAIDERSANIIVSIIELAKKLNMETVCEGVRNQAQLEFLKQQQCDMIQAFLLYKPLPIDEFEDLLNQKD